MKTYNYSVDDPDYTFRYKRAEWKKTEFDLEDEYDLEYLAEECAEDYLHNHDGWEYRSWTDGSTPIKLSIHNDDKQIIATFDVFCEYEPRFSANKI